MSDVIRRATVDDAAYVLAWRAETSASQYQPLRVYDEATIRARLAERGSTPLTPNLAGKVQWTVLADGAPAGWVTLDVTSRAHSVAAIGYTIGEAFRGRGLARRAVCAVRDLAFDPAVLDLERLEANVAVGNVASQLVLERVGFQHEGTARGLLVIDSQRVDHMRYGILRGDSDERTLTP